MDYYALVQPFILIYIYIQFPSNLCLFYYEYCMHVTLFPTPLLITTKVSFDAFLGNLNHIVNFKFGNNIRWHEINNIP